MNTAARRGGRSLLKRLTARRGFRRWWWWSRGVRVGAAGDEVYFWSTTPLGYPLKLIAVPRWFDTTEDACEVMEKQVMGLLRKADQPSPAALPVPTLVDPGLGAKYPTLWSYLTQSAWDDGSPRVTSSLLVFVQDGIMKGLLRDREAGLCLWVAAPGLSQLLGVLETNLGSSAADWRVDREQGKGQTAKRVKRG